MASCRHGKARTNLEFVRVRGGHKGTRALDLLRVNEVNVKL